MKSALLIAGSPFQLMNMKAAISFFQITEYKLYILKDNGSERHNQIINLAEHYQMKYELIDYHEVYYTPRRNILKILKKTVFSAQKGNFDIILHGDYRNLYSLLCFYPLLKNKGTVCFVDDGNATINIFKGKDIDWRVRILYSILKSSMKIKRMPSFNFFTIYDDIKTNKFNVITNKLSEINSSAITDNNIYIVGTNTLLYTEYLGIPIENFRTNFIALIKKLKANHSSSKIIYIPHGRDQYTELQFLCLEYGIEYMKLGICIESYFIINNIYPRKIYAFTSSALYNIKKMFAHTECYNLSIKGRIKEHQTIYDNINIYYEKHNINLIELN